MVGYDNQATVGRIKIQSGKSYNLMDKAMIWWMKLRFDEWSYDLMNEATIGWMKLQLEEWSYN